MVNRGPRGFCLLLFQKAGQRLGFVKVPEATERATKGGVGKIVHPFDEEYGTDTSGLIFGDDLWSTAYYGVTPSLLTQMIGSLNLDWERFVFIDLGSGKGRALLLASQFPFKKIVGVEFVPELSSTATANISRFNPPWKVCKEIESINEDAGKFEYPSDPLVVYIYNPFLAPVMKKCLKHLSSSLEKQPREVYLIYGNPVFERLVKRYAPRFKRQWERMFAFTPEETAADRFGSNEEKVILWKYSA
jgi:hypothetical protein